MKHIFLFALSTFIITNLLAQKKNIDTADFDAWPQVFVGSEQLSPNGKFFSYVIQNQPKGHFTTVVESIDTSWVKEIVDCRMSFTSDNNWAIGGVPGKIYNVHLGGELSVTNHVKQYALVNTRSAPLLVYLTDSNELIYQDLADLSVSAIPHVKKYYVANTNLVYESIDSTRELIYYISSLNLENNEKKIIYQGRTAPINIFCVSDASMIAYLLAEIKNPNSTYQLHLNLTHKQDDVVLYTGYQPVTDVTFSTTTNQLTFKTKDSLWYVNRNEPNRCKIIFPGAGLPGNWGLSTNSPIFNVSKERILFKLNKLEKQILQKNNDSKSTYPPLIWRYTDQDIQAKYDYARDAPNVSQPYLFEYIPNLDTIIRIENERESRMAQDLEKINNYALLYEPPKTEWWWQPSQRAKLKLVRLSDGKKVLDLDFKYTDRPLYDFSLNEKFLIYYAPELRSYMSFDIEKLMLRKIMLPTKASFEYNKNDVNYPDPYFGSRRLPTGLVGWIDSSDYLLVYDEYLDLWKLNPRNPTDAKNLTNGYARRNGIKFTLRYIPNSTEQVIGGSVKTITGTNKIILEGKNSLTKETGFYEIQLHQTLDPYLLFKGPYQSGLQFNLQKAKNEEVWVTTHSTPTEAPTTYLLNNGWASVRALNDVQPQIKYNWYNTELITWRLPNKELRQGILYKPENFDPIIKYPVIFQFYEKSSDGLFMHRSLEWMSDAFLNIPYFIGKGYLVFTPDINYTIGHPGAGALESVLSGRKELLKLGYIDSCRMGLAGHSWGAFEVNYIISHTDLFCAALETAGPSNFTSGYGSLFGKEKKLYQWVYEAGQSRMGKTLWQFQNEYLENSPVLNANKVKTQLLIMHNQLDDAVPFAQGVEWFGALRRLKKPVWMLQYHNEVHGLLNLENQKDFTIRVIQFFDYTLKGTPIPSWMITLKP